MIPIKQTLWLIPIGTCFVSNVFSPTRLPSDTWEASCLVGESVPGFEGVGHEELEQEIDGHWHFYGRGAIRAGSMFFST